MQGSWAISFGMPSMSPDVWRADVEWTRDRLPKEKLLSVSVVATAQPGWSEEDVANDFAQCARWALDSGADCVETNFSCPNVATCDGQLFQQPAAAGRVAERVREAIGASPYLIKIGLVNDSGIAAQLLDAIAPFADALAMTNCISAQVRGLDNALMFDAESRGIGGDCIRAASVEQVSLFSEFARIKRACDATDRRWWNLCSTARERIPVRRRRSGATRHGADDRSTGRAADSR